MPCPVRGLDSHTSTLAGSEYATRSPLNAITFRRSIAEMMPPISSSESILQKSAPIEPENAFRVPGRPDFAFRSLSMISLARSSTPLALVNSTSGMSPMRSLREASSRFSSRRWAINGSIPVSLEMM